jgi:S-DNA-T family DNA segregation ATPase FtsK/SpoIIIE
MVWIRGSAELLLIFGFMANRLKSKKGKPADRVSFKPEKEVSFKATEAIKDERVHKIAGAFSLLFASFLFIAFTSYLFTWKEDQPTVLNGFSNNKASNLLGNLGAYVSYEFINHGFGIASYFICSFFFILGVNWLFRKKIFSIGRNLRYVIGGLLFLSMTLSFITRGSDFSWGGAVGEMISDWLIRLLGWIGTAALLFVSGLAFIIWRFNPVFKVPAIAKKDKKPFGIEANEQDGARLFVDESVRNGRGNLLKEGGTGAVIPSQPESNSGPDSEIRLVEKESSEDSPGGVSPDELFKPKPVQNLANSLDEGKSSGPRKGAGLELEIKQVSPKEEVVEELPFIKPNVPPLPDYEPTWDLRDYQYPSLDLLDVHGSEKIIQDAGELEANKNQIINTLKNYDIDIQKISATVGSTVTLYEIVPVPGVRISRIKNLEDDIALSLAALGIRIIAPIPGKGTIGIEVPNAKKTVVSMRTLLSSDKFQHNHFNLPIAIGKKIDNENFIVDLTAMPHLLMAGATGQGKSVGLNAILVSLLYKKHPSQLKFVLVDPKKVELSLYRIIEKYFLIKISDDEEPIITDTKKVIYTLNALCEEMDQRYDYLKEAGCRNIREYNDKFVKRKLNPELGHKYLPFIVLIIDEFADLIMTAGKEIEMPIARLAQLARAVGIHLIIATQRPSVNIITGTIKANFPARIAFKVSSKIDSRTILDVGGSEQLIGKGDMLISYNGEITRLQCAFVDTPEVERVCDFIGAQKGIIKPYELPKYEDEKELQGKEFDRNDKDELFEEAARLIVQSQVGSTSLLQRRMKLGYNRAGRLMDQLEAAGVVGPSQGSKAREVLIRTEMELDHLLG